MPLAIRRPPPAKPRATVPARMPAVRQSVSSGTEHASQDRYASAAPSVAASTRACPGMRRVQPSSEPRKFRARRCGDEETGQDLQHLSQHVGAATGSELMKTLVSSSTGVSGAVLPSIGSAAGESGTRRSEIELREQCGIDVGERAPLAPKPRAEFVLSRQGGERCGDDHCGGSAAGTTRCGSKQPRWDLRIHMPCPRPGGKSEFFRNLQGERRDAAPRRFG